MKAYLYPCLAFALCGFTVSSFAEDTIQNNQEKFYIKALIGGTTLNNVKKYGIKLKSNFSATPEIGIGYYFTNDARMDVTVAMPINPTLNKKTTSHATNPIKDETQTEVLNYKLKPKITSFLINGYVDIYKLSNVKIFIGAGVGTALVKEKFNYKEVFHGTEDGEDYSEQNTGSNPVKKKFNFAWQVSVGASTQIADNITAELSYSYKDFGKTRDILYQKKYLVKGSRYMGHNVAAGLRVAL